MIQVFGDISPDWLVIHILVNFSDKFNADSSYKGGCPMRLK